MTAITEQHIVFKGEVQLAGWTDAHNSGAKITFQLSDPAELECFRHLTVKHGNRSGQRMMLVAVQIGEDEKPVLQHPLDAPPKEDQPKGGPLAKLAGQWRSDEKFQAWVAQHHQDVYLAAEDRFVEPSQYEVVEEVMYRLCGIRTLALLDHEPAAAAAFEEHFRAPYRAALGG